MWQMEKIFNQKNFNNFVWSPLGSRGNIYINFCLQVHLQVSAVNEIRGKFAAGIVDTGGKLSLVSTTLGELVAKFAAGVVDTGGKFATGVVESGDKFATGVIDTSGAP